MCSTIGIRRGRRYERCGRRLHDMGYPHVLHEVELFTSIAGPGTQQDEVRAHAQSAIKWLPFASRAWDFARSMTIAGTSPSPSHYVE